MEYFRKEWESGGERQALKTCLLALHSVRTEEEYKAQARELGADDELMSEVAEVLRVLRQNRGSQWKKKKQMLFWKSLLENITEEPGHNCFQAPGTERAVTPGREYLNKTVDEMK